MMGKSNISSFLAQGDLVYLPAKTSLTKYDSAGVANTICYTKEPRDVVYNRGLGRGRVEVLYEGELWCVQEESCFMT